MLARANFCMLGRLCSYRPLRALLKYLIGIWPSALAYSLDRSYSIDLLNEQLAPIQDSNIKTCLHNVECVKTCSSARGLLIMIVRLQ
jgi:hypothetical protein